MNNITLKMFINDRRTSASYELETGHEFILDLENDSILRCHFYHCNNYADIPILNHLRAEFVIPDTETILEYRNIYIARDLQLQLYSNMPAREPVDSIPTSWEDVFHGAGFKVGYPTPMKFNIQFDEDHTNVGTYTMATFMDNNVLDDIFNNIRLGYKLTYTDDSSGTQKTVFTELTSRITSVASGEVWRYGVDIWGNLSARPPICEENAAKLSNKYSLTVTQYENIIAQLGASLWRYFYYLKFRPEPINSSSGSPNFHITDDFGVPYYEIKNLTNIIVEPIAYVGTIADHRAPLLGYDYLTNRYGERASRTFKKQETDIIQSINIRNADSDYNPETLVSGSHDWLGNYDERDNTSDAHKDTSLSITVTLREE